MSWENEQWKWSRLIARCSDTRRTSETVAQYAAMDRDRQGDIKDVGGFVGGFLLGGLRRNDSVHFRSCATLDIDFGNDSVWADFTTIYDCAALMYSTHKHTPQAPRLRLIVPFNRAASPEEYEPICRRIAADIGLHLFDQSTFQLPRLFYWPSTPADGVYVFEYQDAPQLDIDAVLATYDNWRDPSQWPKLPDATVPHLYEATRAQDPRQKPGIIGAFCRAYPIEEAITHFLAAVYTRNRGNRFTYVNGSTTGGLVCYDHLYAYSNHGTDPAGGRLHNAFDLVRVHLYGDLDRAATTDDPTRLPSYEAMCAMAAADENVRRSIADEMRASLNDDFADIPAETDVTVSEATDTPKPPLPAKSGPNDKPQKARPIGVNIPEHIAAVRARLPEDAFIYLDLAKDANPKPTAPNARLILLHHPDLKDKIYLNTITGYYGVDGDLPWPRLKENTEWTNADDASLRNWFATFWAINAKEKIADALTEVAVANARNPLRDYLESLVWDGIPRLDTLIIDYIGAEDSPLNRAITRMHFAAAVARVFEPGCKYDCCLIIQGPQGCGKSTLIAIMGGDYYREGVTFSDPKTYAEELHGTHLVELGELKDLGRADLENVKACITKTADICRPAYAQRKERFLRTCIFFGTSNNQFILKDATGARRFPIIVAAPERRRMGDSWFGTLAQNRDQIWAEAVHAYRSGTPRDLDRSQWEEMVRRQADFTDDDGLAELAGDIEAFINIPLPYDWPRYNLDDRRNYFHQCSDITARGPVARNRVCAAEYLREYLQRDPTLPGYKLLVRKFNRILEETLSWKPISLSRHAASVHGRQRSYERPSLLEASPDEEDL